jgi:DNA polymerase-3 subunit gamma/tau
VRPTQTKPAQTEQATVTRPESGSDWLSLLQQLNLSGQVRELARNVQLKSRSEDRWDFVIAPALRHLGSETCVSRLSRAISDHTGHSVSVRLLDEEGGDLMTAAAMEERHVRMTISEAEKAINDDPTVKALQERMGAKVVDDSIQPLQ